MLAGAGVTYSDKPRAGVGGVMLSCRVGGRLVGRQRPEAHYGRVRLVTSTAPRHHILHPEGSPALGGGGAVKHHDLLGVGGEVRD